MNVYGRTKRAFEELLLLQEEVCALSLPACMYGVCMYMSVSDPPCM